MSNPSRRSPFEPAGFFALRTPMLPFAVLQELGDGLSAAAASETALADAVAADADTASRRLRQLVATPLVREALFCASPTLDEAIDAWLVDPSSSRAAGVVPILVRYVARMAARPTPFGLFSGCSVGAVSADGATRLTLTPRDEYVRRTRFDTHYLSLLCDVLAEDPALRAEIVHRPSSGLVRTSGGQVRYAEGRVDRSTRGVGYHLVSIQGGDALDVALSRAQGGARLGEIAAAIVEADGEVTLEEAGAFVDELVTARVLVPDLTPYVTGPQPVVGVLEALAAAPSGHAARAVLESTRAELAEIDSQGLGVPCLRYRDVAARLRELPAEVDLRRLFQIDLYKPSPAARVGRGVLAEIERAVGVLSRIGPPIGETALARFRKAFEDRFERRQVRLVDALDDERGVGFDGSASDPSPLLDGLGPVSRAEAAHVPLGAREAYLVQRFAGLSRAGARRWDLDAADLAALAPTNDAAALPDSFAAIVELAAASPEAVDAGDFGFTLSVSAPGGALLLGRFCHGDADLREHVERLLRAEEALHPGAVFAEIVHVSEGRLGNVLCRPVLRSHEIPYLGRSGAPLDRCIAIEDLMVSVEHGRIVLRSASLGREVLPRLTTAHNHHQSTLAIYRFLCALASQDQARALAWSWGPLASCSFLPRVSAGRFVLSVARWTLSEKRCAALGEKTAAGRFRAARVLRDELGLPRWVTVVDGDNVLPVDLDNVLSVETLAALVKRRKLAVLEEMFPSPSELCARGPEGPFCHEMVIPFVSRRPASPARAAPRAGMAPRTFAPGSEWLYAKVYAGSATLDAVLVDLVAPLVESSLAAGAIDRWFFIRYRDPEGHLRIRMRGSPERLWSETALRLHDALSPWIADGRVVKFVFDTYEREVERYGGDAGIDASERMFWADSEAVVAALASSEGDARADARWRLALAGMQRLLDDLRLDLDRRIALLRRLRASFAEEHGAGVPFEKTLGARFRRERPALEALLAADPKDADLAAGLGALAHRSERLAPVVSEVERLAESGELGCTVDDLASSWLHMHCNRWIPSDARLHELVLYDFLLRLHESIAARARKKGAPAAASTAPTGAPSGLGVEGAGR